MDKKTPKKSGLTPMKQKTRPNGGQPSPIKSAPSFKGSK